DAVCYEARNKVLWRIGDVVNTFHGGHNNNGELSTIDVYPILGCSGPLLGDKFFERTSIHAERGILYNRDLHLCAYCGNQFSPYKLTIDHVMPRSRGGKHIWTNTVTACKPCNLRKGARTPEEANMLLLYVPYIPTSQEKMVMKNRHILADQMEFLMTRVPKHSRLWKNYKLGD
ncbi:MAG: HNH endonuclease, partial [Rhabdochlamydiaceae bacterium]